MKTAPSLTAKAPAGGCFMASGISSTLAVGDKPPETIQLFPPGNHRIVATKNILTEPEPFEMAVTVDESLASIIKDYFDRIVSEASNQKGYAPFIDFNHENRDASAWVKDVFWAGEDPVNGGIRAKVEWSKPGEEAITGKSYRHFSPNFRVSQLTGKISGTYSNMGGLVNTPAFVAIDAFFAAKHAETADMKTQQKENTMNELIKALVAAGLLSAVPTDDAAAVADFQKNWAKMEQDDAAMAKCATDKLAATTAEKDAEIVSAKQAVTDIQAKLTGLQQTHADAVVSAAVAAGYLAPKDTKARDLWTKAIAADPEAVNLLHSFNVVSAKASVSGPLVDITQPVVLQKPDVAVPPGSDKWDARVAAVQAKENCTRGKAIQIAAKAYPAEYLEHRSQVSVTK